jgi:hypothetical protein
MSQFSARAEQQRAVASIAAQQHGVLTTAQLRECGLGSSAVRDWTRRGRLHRVHRGVHAVGHHGLSLEGGWLAAVLALGATAVLSHRSAAMLWRMLERASTLVHVTVIGTNGRERRRGLVVHRSSVLTKSETTVRNSIPVTSPARTLRDLRGNLSAGMYRRAVRQAEFLRLPLGDLPEADGTRSGLERSFIAFCGRHRLPRPEVNVKLGPYTADFLWRAERVVVETDSYRTHGGPVAFEEDRERDLWLKAAGFQVIRVTDRQLRVDPATLAVSLRRIVER